MGKELLFSVGAKDCRFDYYRGSGAGGQKRNKTSSACRVTHIESGAVGQSEDGRSQRHNKELAFKRMATSDTFKKWHRMESSRRMGTLAEVEAIVDREMKNIKVECQVEGKWEKWEETQEETS